MMDSALLSGAGDGVTTRREYFRLPLTFLICLLLDRSRKGLIESNLDFLVLVTSVRPLRDHAGAMIHRDC